MPTTNTNNTDVSKLIATALNGKVETTETLDVAAQLEAARLENERLKAAAMAAEIAKLQAENAAIVAKSAAKSAAKANPAPVVAVTSTFAGTYPDSATDMDRVILDCIHATKAKADPKYPVPASFGAPLYAYFHSHGATTEQMKPFVEDACKRGIVTRIFGQKAMMYFDSREVAPRAIHERKPLNPAVKSAFALAFGAK